MKYMNCVLLCKSYRSSILTYAIVIARGAKRNETKSERDERKGREKERRRMNERNVCVGEGEKNVIAV